MPRSALQPHLFDVAAELATLGENHAYGGIASFIGQVRGANGLLSLTLEHYPGMTERALARIAEEAEHRFAPCQTVVIHRTGRLLPGDPIVLVAAASPQRAHALQAVANMIDRLKTDAPFWKKEEYETGTNWVQATAEDATARAAWVE